MYYVVTGAAGFIGSNIVKALNERGIENIIAVDNLSKGDKFINLVKCDIADYLDKDLFLSELSEGAFDGAVDRIIHQGACSDTQETDGRYMMENNFQYSLGLLEYCQREEVPFIYASSASVYGAGPNFMESREYEQPLNVYGYSKFLFDQIVRRRLSDAATQIVGLRYFNVYGPQEQHKNRMASVAFHCFNQYQASGKVKLFESSGGYGSGEQRRDFIHVDDVVSVNLYFLDHADRSGIFNVGTGAAQTFNEVAVSMINTCRRLKQHEELSKEQLVAEGIIEYIPFPPGLREKYQSFTQADIKALREAGYNNDFLAVSQGVSRYAEWLMKAG